MPSRPLFISPRFSQVTDEDFTSIPIRPGYMAPSVLLTVPEGYRPQQVRSLIQLSDGAFLGSLRLNARTKALEAVPAVNRAAAVRYPSAESAAKVIERNPAVLQGASAVPVA